MSKEPMSEERVDAARNRGLGMTRINDYANTEPAFIRTVGRQMVWLADEIARLRARNEKLEEGNRQAFVMGARWWEFHVSGATMWQSDQKLAQEEFDRRVAAAKEEL